jgi:hypothetical protein
LIKITHYHGSYNDDRNYVVLIILQSVGLLGKMTRQFGNKQRVKPYIWAITKAIITIFTITGKFVCHLLYQTVLNL